MKSKCGKLAKRSAIFACAVLAAACDPRVDEQFISYFPAPSERIARASDAAEACGATTTAWGARESLFRNLGYARPEDPRLVEIEEEKRAIFLVSPAKDILIQLGGKASLGGSSPTGCIIAVHGMTPKQAYELALPWANQFAAPTNAELGQGLAKKAIEVWNLYEDDRIVRIAAYKTWEDLGVPGAAVRLVAYSR